MQGSRSISLSFHQKRSRPSAGRTRIPEAGIRESRKEKIMKTVIIDEAHSGMIQEAIDEAEGQARMRTIDASTVIKDTATIAKYFGVSRRAMDGLVVDVDPYCQYFPNAYTKKAARKAPILKSSIRSVRHILRRSTGIMYARRGATT